MAEPVCDDPEDLKIIEEILLPGENIEGVFCASPKPELRRTSDRDASPTLTLIGLTSRRLMLRHSDGYTETNFDWRSQTYEPYPMAKFGT